MAELRLIEAGSGDECAGTGVLIVDLYALNRRYPDRIKMRPSDADGFRDIPDGPSAHRQDRTDRGNCGWPQRTLSAA